ncbi:uncharacterized protein B0H18DRAFT_121916 [Fomitopsis serialis]|uniref:uncharacterized protein n=1 Tax=Fomitopsis serialis TaxID=139415 RepID=UPI00200788DF|nr:uncharacterized protein B0H18DRAFT_121916 [Neoantrodia serialis]KAH9914795.1 hypothetical protein B0H18DRAFT_121916 [Neoantrodia serialis]
MTYPVLVDEPNVRGTRSTDIRGGVGSFRMRSAHRSAPFSSTPAKHRHEHRGSLQQANASRLNGAVVIYRRSLKLRVEIVSAAPSS